MKKIRIKHLKLENFKCHRYLELNLEGRNASIYGDNATGKTSVYDALTWLLFGKDSAGNGEKNIDVKPLDSTGAVADRDAITSVEAALQVAGEVITLKRTYREVWSTKRGSTKETYDGNTSEYFVDGVPCKKYAFDDKIKALVPEDVFRLLTSVGYFPDVLPWQKRRAVLFDMAGTLTDREIMAKDPTFAPLLEGMGKLALEDYKKKLTSEKKGFTGVKNEAPARLNECQKTVRDLTGLDFAAAKAEAATLEEQRGQLSAQLIALEHNGAVDAKRLEIWEAQLELDKLTAENNAFRAQQTAGAVNVGDLRRQLEGEKSRLSATRTLLEGARRSIAGYDRSIEESRSRWIAVNGEAFTGGTCPTCGQTLPFEQLRAATETFEAQKRQRLKEIEDNAAMQKESRAAAESRIQSLQAEITDRENRIKELESQIQAANAARVTPVDMEGYADQSATIRARIQRLEGDLQAMNKDTAQVKAGLRSELETIEAQIKHAQEVIAKEGVLQYARQRIEEIQTDANNAAAALEAIEQMLYLIEEYTRHKARFVEEGVNSLFRVARFRLFREQANGGLEERCDVVCGGVPYLGLNNGAKINVGIDIINTLSRHFGVAVPLFVDNAESVTRLEYADTQVIRLVVSESDTGKLRCEYEN